MSKQIEDISSALNNFLQFGVYNAIPIYKNPHPETDRNIHSDLRYVLGQLEKANNQLKNFDATCKDKETKAESDL